MMTAIRGAAPCRACSGQVLWVTLPSGKRMPVDPEPDDDGNVAAYRDARGVWVGHVLRADERTAPFEKRFVPHFATCAPVIAQRQAERDGARGGNVVPFRRPVPR